MNNPTNSKLIYTFYNWNKVAYKLLRGIRLPGVNVSYIKNIAEAHRLAKHVLLSKYETVLGIADQPKHARRHRYETRFANKYGQNKILANGKPYYTSTLEIQEGSDLYCAKEPTKGPCNRSAYLLARTIEDNNLHTKFAFVHICKRLTTKQLFEDITGWLGIY